METVDDLRPTVLVFLKAPRVGFAKTRLARELGSDEALRIYRELTERQLAALPRDWTIEIHFAPVDAEAEMRAWLGDAASYQAQAEGNLGVRLAHAFEAAFTCGAAAVLAIGSDCPELDQATLREAAAALAHHDAVIGPAEDGGYYLIGLRRRSAVVFENIPWSTAEVCTITLARASRAGLRCALLEKKADIDVADDWRRYLERRAGPRLAVVIPALNEALCIRECVTQVRCVFPRNAVVVVDGGSTDGTPTVAEEAGAIVVSSSRGRGLQCRIGAAAMAAEWLLFLHADTVLPRNAGEIVTHFTANPDMHIATFKLRFDRAGWFLRACEWFTRFDSVFTRFGDQGILIRRSFYDELGGFPEWPLFEDVWLLQQARKRTRVHSLPGAVTTSARRFTKHGTIRQQWRNACLLVRYLCGANPSTLARSYERSANAESPQTAAAMPQMRSQPETSRSTS